MTGHARRENKGLHDDEIRKYWSGHTVVDGDITSLTLFILLQAVVKIFQLEVQVSMLSQRM